MERNDPAGAGALPRESQGDSWPSRFGCRVLGVPEARTNFYPVESMKEFILRIISQFQGRGAKDAQRGLKDVETQAKRTQKQAKTGAFDRFFAKIRTGARQAGSAMGGLIKSFTKFAAVGVSGAVAGAIALITYRMSRLSEETVRSAQVTGTTQKQWQQLERTARSMDVTAADLEGGLRRMNRRAKDMESDFRAAGIEVRNSNGQFRNSIDVFFELSDTIAGMSDIQDQAALSQRLMGEGGQRLLPMLRQGSVAIREQMDSINVMSDETIESLEAAKQEWADFIDEITVGASRAIGPITETAAAFNRLLGGGGISEAHDRQLRDFRQAIEDVGIDMEKRFKGFGPFADRRQRDEMDRLIRGQETMIFSEDERQRIQERAFKIGEERLRQERDEAEEKRAQAKAEAEQAAAERERTRIAEARRVLEEGATKRARDEMSAKEELASIEAEAAEVRKRAEEGDAAAAHRFNSLKERERELRSEISEIQEDNLSLEERIAAATRGTKQEAEELTEEERRRRELLEKAAADPFGKTLEGRAARNELQDRGDISRHQQHADEQLLTLQARQRRGENIFSAASSGGRQDSGVQVVPLRQDSAPIPEGIAADTRNGAHAVTQAGDRVVSAVEGHQDAVLAVLEDLAEKIGRNTEQLQNVREWVRQSRN